MEAYYGLAAARHRQNNRLAARRQPVGEAHRAEALAGRQERQRLADRVARADRQALVVNRDLRAAGRRHEVAGVGDTPLIVEQPVRTAEQ